MRQRKTSGHYKSESHVLPPPCAIGCVHTTMLWMSRGFLHMCHFSHYLGLVCIKNFQDCYRGGSRIPHGSIHHLRRGRCLIFLPNIFWGVRSPTFSYYFDRSSFLNRLHFLKSNWGGVIYKVYLLMYILVDGVFSPVLMQLHHWR